MAFRRLLGALALGLAAAAALAPISDRVIAQDNTEKELEKFRAMLKEDPFANPGLLDADRGEALWTSAKGDAKATLEKCDLGKRP